MIRELEPDSAANDDMVQRALGMSHAIAWEWNLETGDCRRSGPVRAELGIAPNAPTSAFMALVHSADLPIIELAVVRIRDHLETHVAQFRLAMPSGEERWVEASGTPLLDDFGRCVAIRGVLLNITARKLVEQKLAETERRLAQESTLLRQIHDLSLLDPANSHPWQLRRQLLDLALSAGDAQIAVLHHRHSAYVDQLLLDRVHAPALAATVSQALAQMVQPLCAQVLASGQRLLILRAVDEPRLQHPQAKALLLATGIGGLQCTPLRSRSGRMEGTVCTLWCGPRALSNDHLMLLDVVAMKLAETLLQPEPAPSIKPPAGPDRDIIRLRLNILTPQQRRIADLLVAGRSNREVASALGIAENTVKAHVSTVLRRMGLHNRTQIAVLAQQEPGASASSDS